MARYSVVAVRQRGVRRQSGDFVGIRAHDLRIGENDAAANIFPCWLVAYIESPFETTLYLRLHSHSQKGDAAHLEAEVSREQWIALSAQQQPLFVSLDPSCLLFLEGGTLRTGSGM